MNGEVSISRSRAGGTARDVQNNRLAHPLWELGLPRENPAFATGRSLKTIPVGGRQFLGFVSTVTAQFNKPLASQLRLVPVECPQAVNVRPAFRDRSGAVTCSRENATPTDFDTLIYFFTRV